MQNQDTKSRDVGPDQLSPESESQKESKPHHQLVDQNLFEATDSSGVFALSPKTGKFEPATDFSDPDRLLARAKKMSGVALAVCSAALAATIAICVHSMTTNEHPFGDVFLAIVLSIPCLGCFIYACVAAGYVGKCKQRGVEVPQYLRIMRVVNLLLVPISFILMFVLIGK